MNQLIDSQAIRIVQDRTENRRRVLLTTALSTMILVALFFIPVNIARQDMVLVITESIAVLLLSGFLFCTLKRIKIKLIAALYLGLASIWGIIAASSPETDDSVFVWISLAPAFSFFMFGKKISRVFTALYIPLASTAYLLGHYYGGSPITVERAGNQIAFIIVNLLFCMFYETVRQEDEEDLVTDIIQRMKAEADKQKLIDDLHIAISEIKVLQGLLPVCCHCKKIRNDENNWESLEQYIRQHTDAEFTHGLCPCCAKELYPEYDLSDAEKAVS